MNRLVITCAALTLCLMASCGSKPSEQAAGSGSGSSTLPARPVAVADAAPPALEICQIGRAAVDQATCPKPEDREGLVKAKQAMDGLVDTIGKLGTADPRQFQVLCAQMLLAIERDAKQVNCTIELEPAKRAQITAFLDAWYGQRTPVTPTGDAAADAVVARIVAMRDAACECRDAACLELVDRQLVTIEPMPQAAPRSARDLAGKLLDDAARCASRVRSLEQSR